MGFYRKVQKKIADTGIYVERLKNRYSEAVSIHKKKSFYESVKWTEVQTLQFNSFWQEHYGKAIPDKWHKLYQNANGIFNAQYFPEYLYSTQLEWCINPEKYTSVLSDKNLLHVLFGDISELHIPLTILSCANGSYKDGKQNITNKNGAVSALNSISGGY